MISLSNYFICVFFISNFMKSSAVYEASLCTFVLRSATMIRPSMRFDISLQNFKKTSSRYYLSADRKKKRSEEHLVIILAVERKL